MELLQHEGLPFQLEVQNDRHFFRYPNGILEPAGRNEVLLFAILVRLEELHKEQKQMKLDMAAAAVELQTDLDTLTKSAASRSTKKPAAAS